MNRFSLCLALLLSGCATGFNPPNPVDLSEETDDDTSSTSTGGNPLPRLRPVMLQGTDGSVSPLGNFYDSVRQEECAWNNYPDGRYRCLPPAHYTGAVWSDASCTEPLVMQQVSTCPGVEHNQYAWVYADGCPATYHLIGEVWEGEIHTGSPGACYPADRKPYLDSGFAFLSVGEKMDLSDFVAGAKSY